MQVIGLAGAAGSGKSEVARIIRERFGHGECVIIPFAKPLKDLCRREFGWDGKKDARGRRLLQVVGTDAGREYNPRIWVEKWFAAVENARLCGVRCVIADDVRFANESGAVRAWGGAVWRVERPDAIVTGAVPHASELPLADHLIDGRIVNKGTVNALGIIVVMKLLSLGVL